jgi:ABC-2 type transport system permease protein
MLRRIWALTSKEFIHLRNDWWLPAFMLIGGALELLLVGWATSRPITNLPFMVLDHDQSASSRALVASIENTGTFRSAQLVGEFGTIQEAMERGQINAALLIPPGYNTQLIDPKGRPQVAVLLNGAESTPAMAALRSIEGVTRQISERLSMQRLGLDEAQYKGFAPSLRVRFNAGLSEALYTTPAELGLMLEFTVLLFAALSFSRERELGTLEQLLVMPFSSLEIIAGKSLPVILVGMADFTIMLGMIHFAFGVPVRGSLVLLFLIAFGYVLVELGKGLVISVIARSQHQAFLLILMIGMADFMFTGYAAPVESMPPVLQYVALVVPAHHWLTILRGILLKGNGLYILWPNLLALGLLGLIIGIFSLRFVRRTLT